MIRALKESEVTEQADEVLSLMRGDWGLGTSPINGKHWVQQGGCGLGGTSKNVHHQVMDYLLSRSFVVPVDVMEGQRQDYQIK